MKLPVVNALRGVAILGVVAYHLLSHRTSPGASILDTLVQNGWMGVNLFFVLSGFVLTLPYLDGRRSLERGADTTAFYRRRARRLFPLLWVNVAVALLLVRAGVVPVHVDFGSVTFLYDLLFYATATFPFVPDLYYPPPNWVLWSLGLEVWFSILFPALLAALRRVGPGVVLAAVLVLSFCVRVLGESLYGGVFNGTENAQLDPVKDSVLGRLDEFVTGMAIAALHARGVRARRLAVPLVLAGAASLFLAMRQWDAVHLGTLGRAAVPALYDLTTAGFGLLLFGALDLPRVARRVVANAPLQLAGMMCYSLYVWHGLLIFVVFRDRPFGTLGALAYGAALLVVAAASYRWIEFGHVRDRRALFVPPPAAP